METSSGSASRFAIFSIVFVFVISAFSVMLCVTLSLLLLHFSNVHSILASSYLTLSYWPHGNSQQVLVRPTYVARPSIMFCLCTFSFFSKNTKTLAQLAYSGAPTKVYQNNKSKKLLIISNIKCRLCLYGLVDNRAVRYSKVATCVITCYASHGSYVLPRV